MQGKCVQALAYYMKVTCNNSAWCVSEVRTDFKKVCRSMRLEESSLLTALSSLSCMLMSSFADAIMARAYACRWLTSCCHPTPASALNCTSVCYDERDTLSRKQHSPFPRGTPSQEPTWHSSMKLGFLLGFYP